MVNGSVVLNMSVLDIVYMWVKLHRKWYMDGPKMYIVAVDKSFAGVDPNNSSLLCAFGFTKS